MHNEIPGYFLYFSLEQSYPIKGNQSHDGKSTTTLLNSVSLAQKDWTAILERMSDWDEWNKYTTTP